MVVSAIGCAVAAVGWLSAVLACVFFLKFGDWKKAVYAAFHGDSERMFSSSDYWCQRSLIALVSFALMLLYECTVNRTMTIDYYVFRSEKASLAYTCAMVASCMLTFPGVSAITLIRAWRLRVKHMYYVVILNSDWSKLMDPSLEDSISFWIKYKAVLTSDRGVLAMIGSWVVANLIGSVFGLRDKFDLLRMVASGLIVVMCMLAIALVARLHNSPSLLRVELICVASMNLFGFLFNIASVSIINVGNRLSSIVSLSIVGLMYVAVFVVAFVWIPYRVSKADSNRDGIAATLVTKGTTAKLFTVLSDAKRLTEFMRFCCKHFCSENLLALLEIREFKQMLRKQLVKELRREVKAAKHKLQTTLTLSSQPSKSVTSVSKSLDASTGTNSVNVGFFATATAADNFEFADFIDEEWTRWDQSGIVKLEQLGCKSAIVDGRGDARSKALALCEKYFEWDAEFTLNVSFQNRSRVLALVGKDTTVELEPVTLLYVFDEAMYDVFDNLTDPLHPFLHANAELAHN